LKIMLMITLHVNIASLNSNIRMKMYLIAGNTR
jgi:hypothetical protein